MEYNQYTQYTKMLRFSFPPLLFWVDFFGVEMKPEMISPWLVVWAWSIWILTEDYPWS